uniref:Zinc finger PHD-type domain-containing protein n=1 Tax=Ananas comosus var. bracteatus TaxID=296719 RepID=A0A6V7QYS2_ANACO
MISLNALLAWNLVANTLTGREDVDPSILAVLVSNAPNFSTDAPEALRNVVALASLDERRGGVRFLRSGMRPMPRPPVDASVPSTGASCASSHSNFISNAPYFSTDALEDLCNVVEAAGSKESSGGVRCLHSEIPSTSRPPINASGPCAEAPRSNPSEVGNLGNMGEDRLEKYRRDIGQFILQERAYVPKVTLDQVKESILEGKYPALFSFLKHSGPVRRRDQDDLLPSNFYVDQERLKRLKFSTCDYGKKISQEDPSGFVEHNQHVTDSDGTAHLQMDDVGVEGNTIQLSERNGDTLKPPDKKITNLDGGKRRLSAQTAAALFPIDCTQILQRDVSIPQSNSTIRPNLPLNEHGSLIPTRTEKDQHPSNIIVIPDSASDDDAEDTGYTPDDDEMLAAEKHCLLSSQANNNQDSIAGDWTEQCWCMECDEGDQLLTCSLCLKAFRESCLGSVRFNEEGLFYCCFCTHGRADLGAAKRGRVFFKLKKTSLPVVVRIFVKGEQGKLELLKMSIIG